MKTHKGHKQTIETKMKISLANLGHPVSKSTRMAISKAQKGKIYTLEECLQRSIALKGRHISIATEIKKGQKFPLSWRKNIAKAKVGNLNPMKNPETRKKVSLSNTGVKRGPQPFFVKMKISKANTGKILTEEHKNKLKIARRYRILPLKDTSIEIKIQDYLKQLNIEFYTHKYMNINHAYQCDIFIPRLNMVIECDGNYWHKYPTGRDIDNIRTKELIEQGFKVLRLWEVDIKQMSIDDFKNKLSGGQNG